MSTDEKIRILRDALLEIARHSSIDWVKVTATSALKKADLK